MNPLSGPRQQQQKQQQKQKTLRIKKQGNTLEFHSRLIEATEGTTLSKQRLFLHPLQPFGYGCRLQSQVTVHPEWLLSRAISSTRIVLHACSGVTSSAAFPWIASRR